MMMKALISVLAKATVIKDAIGRRGNTQRNGASWRRPMPGIHHAWVYMRERDGQKGRGNKAPRPSQCLL